MAGTNLGSGLEEVSPDVTPNPPPPPPQASAPMVPTPPPSGNPPMSESLGMPANMAPKPPIPPAVADAVHHNILGRAVSALMGSQADYKVDPNTGATVAVPSKPQPGDIWRHIVAGAILGGAVGGQQPAGGSPVAAGLAGAQAVQAQGTAQDAQRYQRAQEGAKTQLETKKVNQELLFQQAQIANWHKEQLRADARFDLMNPEQLAQQNQFNQGAEVNIKDAGGGKSPVVVDGQDINGKMDNGYAWAAAINKDPSLLSDPQGFHRIQVQHVDTSGLHYDLEKGGWVGTDGKPVDMETRTTHTLYDVPVNFMKQQAPNVSHRYINKIAGVKFFPDDDEPANVDNGTLLDLHTRALKNDLEKTENDFKMKQILVDSQRISAELGRISLETAKEKSAENNAQFERLRQYNASLVADQKEIESKAISREALSPEDKAAVSAIQKQIATNNAAMAAYTAGPTPKPGANPTPVPAPAANPAASQRNGIDMSSTPDALRVYDSLQKAKSMPKDYEAIDEIPALTSPSSKLALAAAAGIPVPWDDVVKMAAAVNMTAVDFARQIESNHGKIEPEAPAQAAPLAMR